MIEIKIPAPDGGLQTLWKAFPKQEEALVRTETEILYGGARGGGKGLILNDLLVTPKGFIRVADVNVGSVLSDPVTGGTTKVLAVYKRGAQPTFKLTFDDGAAVTVDGDHLWSYKLPNHHRPHTKPSSQREYATAVLGSEYPENRWEHLHTGNTLELIEALNKGFRPRVPLTAPVLFTVNGTAGKSVEPYLIGLLLGDGHCESKRIASEDSEIAEYLIERGFSIYATGDRCPTYGATGDMRKRLDTWLRNHNLLKCRAWEKFLPSYVQTAGIEYRVELLRGLMDTDGTVSLDGEPSFCTTSYQLAKDVQQLVWGLGGKAGITTKYPTYTYKGEKLDGRDAYNIRIVMPRNSSIFHLARKRERCRDSWNGGYENMRAIVSIEPQGMQETWCLTVDSSHSLFMTNDYIVTHNTDAGIIWLILGNDIETGTLADEGYYRHPRYRALVLRKNMADMGFWISQAKTKYFPLGATFTARPCQFEFPSGATIVIGHLDDSDAYEKYMGQEFSRILIEELTQIPSLDLYIKVMASLRTPFDEFRRQMFLTANPGGPGGHWVRDRFVDCAEPGTPYIDPETGGTRIFIPARIADNPIFATDRQYLSQLMSLSPAMRRAWLDGDWHAISGQAFEEFRVVPLPGEPPEASHVIQSTAIRLEPWYHRWLSLDWGYAHNAAAYAYCQLPNGQIHVYNELVLNHVTPEELGVEIARWVWPDLQAGSQKTLELFLSPDAFARRTDDRTIADQLAVGIEKILGASSVYIMPNAEGGGYDIFSRAELQGTASITISRAANQRVAGWMFMHSLLRWWPLLPDGKQTGDIYDPALALKLYETDRIKWQQYCGLFKDSTEVLPRLQIHGDRCFNLVKAIPLAMSQDPDKGDPNDIIKTHWEGADSCDSLRYGLFAYKFMQMHEPWEVFYAKHISAYAEKPLSELSGQSKAMMARTAEKKYKELTEGASKPFYWHQSSAKARRLGRN